MTTLGRPETVTVENAPDERPRDAPLVRRPVALGVGFYCLTRLFLMATAYGISVSDHLSLGLLLRSWDAKYYLWDAHHGYPTTLTLRLAKPDAFFPLYPLVVRLFHFVTQLSWVTSGVLVSMLSGALLVAAAALLAEEVFGPERATKAALLLAAFPGSFVACLTYADPLGLALAAIFFLLLHKNRLLLAGLVGALAAGAFSLLALPLVAVAAWVAIQERRPKAFATGAITAAGPLAYLLYLWAHTAKAFFWFRLQRVRWASGLGLSLKHGTLWALQADWEAGAITAVCLVTGGLGLWSLVRARVPRSWIVFSVVIFGVSVLDTGTHITPRLLFAMTPVILTLGARIPDRWLVPILTIATLCLCLCLAIFIPQNWVFFNP